MVVTAIGVPVEEAMTSIRMQTAGSITHVKYDATSPLVSSMKDSLHTDSAEEWVATIIDERKVNVDWMIAMFTHLPGSPGWGANQASDKQVGGRNGALNKRVGG